MEGAAPAGLTVRRSGSASVCLREGSARDGRCELAGLCVMVDVEAMMRKKAIRRRNRCGWSRKADQGKAEDESASLLALR